MKEDSIMYVVVGGVIVVALIGPIVRILTAKDIDEIQPEELKIYGMIELIILSMLVELLSKLVGRLKKMFAKIKAIVNKKTCSDKKSKSIVDEIYDKKKKQYNRALILAFASILLHYGSNIFFHTDVKIEVLIFLGAFIGLIIISRLLMSYRVRKGYYGMNYEECKEVIYYLMDNKDNNDINKGKKIFNEIEDFNKTAEGEAVIVGELQY